VETLEEIRGFFLSIKRDSIGVGFVEGRTSQKGCHPPYC
jgi:hypothetical protein